MTSEQIRYARGLAEAHAPKSTDPMRETTEARSTIELLPRLTLRLLDEREALLAPLRAMLDAHRTEPDESPRGCHCFYAVEHATARAAIAKAESP